jgi:hypothetical protein
LSRAAADSRPTLLTALLAALLLATTGRVAASTYYVAPTGLDQAPGTQAAPWQTLRQALTLLSPGDTLYVRGGLYVENLGGDTPIRIRPGTSQAPVRVLAFPGERPVLQGLLWLHGASYWAVDGLDVTWKVGNQQTWHMVKLTNGVGWSFLNAEVWGANSYAGILVASTVAGEPAGWRIAGNAVHDMLPTHNTNQDHCLYINTRNSPGGVIEHNLLYNATNGEGVKLGGASATDVGPQNVIVRYNTIYNTAQSILVAWSAKNNQIYGNLMQKVGTNYGCIRGYQLTGTGNVATANGGDQAKRLILNDAGYQGVADGGGNVFPLDPQFDTLGPGGFHPLNPAAQAFGYCTTARKSPSSAAGREPIRRLICH